MELMVVTAVAAALMGIAIPSFLSWLPSLRLSSGTRQVATDLQLARMKAISRNAMFQIDFGALPSTSYSMLTDLNNDGAILATEIESGPFSLPEGITVTTVSALLEFQRRGTATNPATIELRNGGGQTKQVQVIAVGRVKVL